MVPDPQVLASDDALVELGQRLRAAGYRFTCVTPATHARVMARCAGEQARTLRDVFGWSQAFSPGLVTADLMALLQRAEGLTAAPQQSFRSAVRWSTLDDLLLVHSAYPTEAADAVFFGPDSYRFAQVIHDHLRHTPNRVEHAVDIGCGTGIGALLIARAAHHARVSAVDINPLALRYTAVNAALADVSNISVKHSDLLDDVPGNFDLIVANPPYMLDVGERTYRHGGGALGAALSLRIVEQARERLTPGGSLLLYTGVAIVDGHDPLLEAVRLRLAGPTCSWVYREIDPDVFGEQLAEPGYEAVERIAAVALTVTRL